MIRNWLNNSLELIGIYKRNYAQTADAVMTAKGIDKKKAETELHYVYDALKQLPINVKRGSLRPPKAN